MYEIFSKILEEKGLKVSDVCRATGISPSSLSDWKKGKYVLKEDKMQQIAEFLGVTSEYLKTGKQPEEYYLNPETAKIAQEVFDNPNLKILFDAARDSKPEDIDMVINMLNRFKE